jgi:hypothetical protein
MKKKGIGELADVRDASLNQVNSHCDESTELTAFFRSIKDLVHAQALEFDRPFDAIGDLFAAAIRSESAAADAESRLADDLNDVVVRFDVIARLSDEAREAKSKAQTARENVDRLQRALAEEAAHARAASKRTSRLRFV